MQYQLHKKSCKTFREIEQNPDSYMIIHYSCESFYSVPNNHTPRITSIAVLDYGSGQVESFSIHLIAEIKNISIEKIEEKYDALEKEMLKRYFTFVKEHKGKKWIHWNMTDAKFGFVALEHRYEVLGGKTEHINASDKYDLASLLIGKYGENYISNPRISNLIQRNNIRSNDFLEGSEEAEAFKNKEYRKLHQSTLRKVYVFESIIKKACDNTLKTDATWRDEFGISMQGILELINQRWYLKFIWTVVIFLLGCFIDHTLWN